MRSHKSTPAIASGTGKKDLTLDLDRYVPALITFIANKLSQREWNSFNHPARFRRFPSPSRPDIC